ncbi:hypothetical protein ACROYT_G013652 [Oculina patagonica]
MMKCRFLFLTIFLKAWISSFPLSDDKCGEVYTAMCTKNPGWQSRQHDVISWICRGRFGIIKLNCIGIETNKTTQTMHSCCKATVNDQGKEDTFHKVTCIMNCTNCGRHEAAFVSHLKWQCQWSSLSLQVDNQGHMRLHTLCNKTTRPLVHCTEDVRGRKHSNQISSLTRQKRCPLSTVMCIENSKPQTTSGQFKQLHSNISWNCTRDSIHIYLSCKASERRNATLLSHTMCCEVSVERENNKLTRPASCLETVITKKGITDHNNTVQILNCEWERSVLNISLETASRDVSWKHGIYYYPCIVPRNNTYLQGCHMKPNTTAAPLPSVTTSSSTTVRSSPPAKWKNGSSTINERLKTLHNTLIRHVHSNGNCTASLIQELLMKIEDTVSLFLGTILDSPANVLPSFFHDFIELHGVITSNANTTLKVPDPLVADQSQGILSLSSGSIDIKKGRLGIVTVVFKFGALCNETPELKMDSSETKRSSSLLSPVVSVLAMTKDGNVNALQKNATLSFKIKRAKGSSIRCIFLNRTFGSNKPFWSDDGMTFADNYEDDLTTTCLTDHLTSFAVLINYNNDQSKLQLTETEKLVLDLITKIGCGFAILCLIACIFTFARVRSLSALRYRIHLNLCVALAASQLVFVAGIGATEIKGVCVAVAVMLHYFFTASFTWMSVEAIHMFSKIVSVFNVQTIRLRYYVAIGWGIPVLIVAISVSVYYEGYSTSKLCWLSLEGGFIWAFLAPVGIIVSINAVVLVTIIVVRVSLKGNPLSPSDNKKFTAALRTVVVLFPLLGLCWFFGFVGVMTNSRPFLYAFVVLSSLQGFFILVFHCIGNTEVRGSIKALKDRHSLESSIRHEQKKRLQESRKMHKNGSFTAATSAEKKSLMRTVPGLELNRMQREKAVNV